MIFQCDMTIFCSQSFINIKKRTIPWIKDTKMSHHENIPGLTFHQSTYCAWSLVAKTTNNSFAVQQEGTERVKVAAVVAQETPGGQEDIHMVAGLQV